VGLCTPTISVSLKSQFHNETEVVMPDLDIYVFVYL
jgi:hypothetical protein